MYGLAEIKAMNAKRVEEFNTRDNKGANMFEVIALYLRKSPEHKWECYHTTRVNATPSELRAFERAVRLATRLVHEGDKYGWAFAQAGAKTFQVGHIDDTPCLLSETTQMEYVLN